MNNGNANRYSYTLVFAVIEKLCRDLFVCSSFVGFFLLLVHSPQAEYACKHELAFFNAVFSFCQLKTIYKRDLYASHQ